MKKITGNMNGSHRIHIALSCAAAMTLSACGSDDNNDTNSSSAGALYAVPTQVYSADFSTSTSYFPLISSLDDIESVSLDDAREVDKRGSLARVGDWVFIASTGGDSIMRRFTVSDSGQLVEDGQLSFANYGISYFSLDPWGNTMINDTTAYMATGTDGGFVVWNPSTMQITGQIAGPDIVRDGYTLENSPPIARGNRMYVVYTYVNKAAAEYLAKPMYLAAYDTTTNEIVSLTTEERCPQLYSRPFMDENEDIYFSGWTWTAGAAVVSDYPSSCALRVKKGEDTFDQSWILNFGEELTGGREAALMSYLGNGKALVDVFYHEEANVPATATGREAALMPFWRLWEFDLNAKTGGPVEAFGFKGGGYAYGTVDDRTLLFLPKDGTYSETTVYDMSTGTPSELFKIDGYSYNVVRVR